MFSKTDATLRPGARSRIGGEQYLAALLELDPAKFKQRIDVALAAVRHQMGEFERNASASAHERQALRDALAALQALQRSN
jgi:hypothetical protein